MKRNFLINVNRCGDQKPQKTNGVNLKSLTSRENFLIPKKWRL
jgi:hypothetical protein